MKIGIQDVTKRFDAFVALDRVNLDIHSGELVALLGPSGSGKTTLLRIMAGLDWPDSGSVWFGGENALALGAAERHVGFVFQHYALFRHMTVFENVAFGLRARPRHQRPGEPAIRKRVGDLLDLVQLSWTAQRYPDQLSGGQRQRIALARALAVEPRVLLLDEPFGALDAKVRKELRRWLRTLHEDIQITSVFVTHDQEEALEVADRVVVLDKGHIIQAGTPQQVHDRPTSSFVHEFIGDSVALPVTVSGGEVRFDGSPIAVDAQGLPDGGATLCARPYDIAVHAGAIAGGLTGEVRRLYGLGALRRAEVALRTASGEHLVEISAPRALPVGVGQIVSLAPQSYRLFPLTAA
ncbi:MAG: sulfate ABC transporter ATP-binding protein [Pseudolabrys sp.]|nr:sulfate ABC transporter ATP-binding protein [Pseudolabrys sp.]MCW5683835.1 sulfate ABC transporter ATP-binding protein [Pseudolabrys sp.]